MTLSAPYSFIQKTYKGRVISVYPWLHLFYHDDNDSDDNDDDDEEEDPNFLNLRGEGAQWAQIAKIR